MPVTGPEELPDRQTPLLASGGESVRVSAVLLGAYKFPTTDSRDDVGFLGSLPLSPRTKSKPVTPQLCGLVILAHRHGVPSTVQPVGLTVPRERLVASNPKVTVAPGASGPPVNT